LPGAWYGRWRDVVLRVVEIDAELMAGGPQLVGVRPLQHEADKK